MARKSRSGSTEAKQSSSRRKWIRRLKIWSISAFCLISLPIIVGTAVFYSALRDARQTAPTLGDKIDAFSKEPTIFYSSDGKELYRRTPEYRVPIRIDDLKEHVWRAMLAAEDKRFMEHPGFDVIGLGRAVVNLAMHKPGGGSTITMQLAKLMYNGNSRSFSRKVKDIAMAKAIEETMSKKQILEVYLNYVYFGQRAYGIYAASKVYFNKTPNDLTIREAAMLARCVRTPSEKNPVKDYDNSIDESDYVLATMREMGWITQEEYQQAGEERPKLAKGESGSDDGRVIAAPYAVRHAVEELNLYYPNVPYETGGYKIELTLDYGLQQQAEKTVKEFVEGNASHKVTAGAFLAADKDGRILVEVGGLNFHRSQYNNATKGRFQPGSSFKSITYTAGMLEGLIHPGMTVPNRRIEYPDSSLEDGVWTPENSNKNESGFSTSLETAFAGSWNRPAIWTLFALGVGSFDDAFASITNEAAAHAMGKAGAHKVAKVAKDVFGINIDPKQIVPSIAIGSNLVTLPEMLSAYSVFMLKGSRVEPRMISKITGPDGTVVAQFEPIIHRDVLDPAIVEDMDGLMARVVSSGTGTAAAIVPNARGKTGTTNSNKDAWFCGYTDGLVGVGWVGNQKLDAKGHSRMLPMQSSVYGGTVTAKIWAKIMNAARTKYAVVIQPPVSHKKRDVPVDKAKPIGTPAPNVIGPDEDKVKPGTITVGPPDDDGQPEKPPMAEKGPETTKPPEKTTPPPESEEVTIEICADTGLVASRYCPETVTRSYKRGKEPKKKCTIHKPDGGQ